MHFNIMDKLYFFKKVNNAVGYSLEQQGAVFVF